MKILISLKMLVLSRALIKSFKGINVLVSVILSNKPISIALWFLIASFLNLFILLLRLILTSWFVQTYLVSSFDTLYAKNKFLFLRNIEESNSIFSYLLNNFKAFVLSHSFICLINSEFCIFRVEPVVLYIKYLKNSSGLLGTRLYLSYKAILTSLFLTLAKLSFEIKSESTIMLLIVSFDKAIPLVNKIINLSETSSFDNGSIIIISISFSNSGISSFSLGI